MVENKINISAKLDEGLPINKSIEGRSSGLNSKERIILQLFREIGDFPENLAEDLVIHLKKFPDGSYGMRSIYWNRCDS
ncbi:hypothetical protein HZA97_04755 [Candidatus Woesearchaeota archaeon]|nr:hypothetical protein [Candidatus Woesearchaeota archaeon]